MARDSSIVQDAAGGVIIQPTWGTLDGGGGEYGGIDVSAIVSNIIAMLGTMALVDDAPKNGNLYARQNGEWVQTGGIIAIIFDVDFDTGELIMSSQSDSTFISDFYVDTDTGELILIKRPIYYDLSFIIYDGDLLMTIE